AWAGDSGRPAALAAFAIAMLTSGRGLATALFTAGLDCVFVATALCVFGAAAGFAAGVFCAVFPTPAPNGWCRITWEVAVDSLPPFPPSSRRPPKTRTVKTRPQIAAILIGGERVSVTRFLSAPQTRDLKQKGACQAPFA